MHEILFLAVSHAFNRLFRAVVFQLDFGKMATVRINPPFLYYIIIRLADTGKHTCKSRLIFHTNQFFLSSLHTTRIPSVDSHKKTVFDPSYRGCTADF